MSGLRAGSYQAHWDFANSGTEEEPGDAQAATGKDTGRLGWPCFRMSAGRGPQAGMRITLCWKAGFGRAHLACD